MPVLLSWLKEPATALLNAGAPPDWYQWPTGLRPWPSRAGLTARGTKRAVKALAVDLGSGELLVRRSVFAPVLEGSGAALRDVPLVDAKGAVLESDFAVLDVSAQAPLEPAACRGQWRDGWLERLEVLGFASTPRAPLFRVGPASQLLCASEPLAEALRDASRGVLGARDVSPQELAQRAVPTHHPAATPPLPANAEAEAAYTRLLRGDGREADRALACESPAWAWWLAHGVDGAARDDTRAGVAKHPVFAALYAARVERAPRPELEAAVRSHWWSARYYAHVVLGEVPVSFEATLREAGYELADERQAAAALRAFLSQTEALRFSRGAAGAPASARRRP